MRGTLYIPLNWEEGGTAGTGTFLTSFFKGIF